MDSIKHSIELLSEHFNNQMAEFQKSLQGASIPATSPTSNLASQFNIFRSFVLSSLESLHLQVDLLSKRCEQLDMRSRRKILLVHGIQESKNEDTAAVVVRELSNHLKMPDLTVDNVSRCSRIGTSATDKPRAILLKFRESTIRNSVWYAKTNLKNTGITVSEFLTKERHGVFMAARQRFGVNRCWTRDGLIFIIAPNGSRHKINTLSELENVPNTQVQGQSSSSGVGVNPNVKDSKGSQIAQATRPKRITKK